MNTTTGREIKQCCTRHRTTQCCTQTTKSQRKKTYIYVKIIYFYIEIERKRLRGAILGQILTQPPLNKENKKEKLERKLRSTCWWRRK